MTISDDQVEMLITIGAYLLAADAILAAVVLAVMLLWALACAWSALRARVQRPAPRRRTAPAAVSKPPSSAPVYVGPPLVRPPLVETTLPGLRGRTATGPKVTTPPARPS